MRNHRTSRVLAVVATIVAGSAHAAEWNANVALASDYIVRGLTRSLASPAIQGSIGIQGDKHWAAGIWASSVELYDGAGRHAEVDYYLAGELPLSRDWRLNGQVTRYEFNGETTIFPYDYTEVAGSLSFQDTITATVAWSPDYSYYTRLGPVAGERLMSYELSGRYPINRYMQLMAGAGHTDFDSPGRAYNYWSGGGEATWDRFSLSVSYISSDSDARRLFQDVAAQNTWVATFSFRIR